MGKEWTDPNIIGDTKESCINCGITEIRPCPKREKCHQVGYDHEGWPIENRYIYWLPQSPKDSDRGDTGQ